MVKRRYIPDRGDLVWLDCDPQTGREQAGHRPAVVLSPALYNGKAGLAVFCPVTSKSKGYPFEVSLPPGLPIAGVALADHIKSLDWEARSIRFVGRLPSRSMEQIAERVGALLGL